MLSEYNIRIVQEPFCDFLEYLAIVHPHLLFGKNSKVTKNTLLRFNMIRIRKELYQNVMKKHTWLPLPDIDLALKTGNQVIDYRIQGGSPIAVGNALYQWNNGKIDGILVTSCWGCDNGLIEESLLRHEKNIPFYFYYDDATPIDERRIQSYAFRLNRKK